MQPLSMAAVWQSTVQTRTANIFSTYAHLLFADGLKEWFLLAYVGYFITTSIVVFILETFFPGLKEDPQFPNLLSEVSILAGFSYFIYLNENLKGYEEPIVAYFRFLQKIQRIARMAAATGVDETRPLLKYLVFLADESMRPGGSVLNEDEIEVPEQCRTMESKYKMQAAQIGKPNEPTAVQRYYICSEETMKALVANDAKLSDRIVDAMHSAVIDIEGVDRARNIVAPIVMPVYITFFVILWFFIWTPATMWARVGVIHTLWFFPLVLIILTSPAIYRMWLGSPWTKMRPWKESQHEKWPGEFSRSIDTLFAAQKSPTALKKE